jgi:predicted nucleic acid-binding protein
MDESSVYVETSVVSYLVARPSRDLITAGHQQLTHEWWESRRNRYRVFASALVLREALLGDPALAGRRRDALRGIPLLEVRSEAATLARELVERGPLPRKAEADAAHIALAAVHGIEYLLTWNCTHIANAEMQPALVRLCRARGYVLPVLCTPEQLMGGE